MISQEEDNIADDHNTIHVQQLMTRASCVYHLYGFLSALNIQGMSVCVYAFHLQVCSIEGPKARHHHHLQVVIEFWSYGKGQGRKVVEHCSLQ